MDESQVNLKRKLTTNDENDDLMVLKRSQTNHSTSSYKDILCLIEKYIKTEDGHVKKDHNSNDLLSLAVLALDQHEKSQEETSKCTDDCCTETDEKLKNIYLNFYIDEEIVLDVKEYKLYECNLCFKSFKHIDDLKTHLNHNCSKEKLITCVYCDKSFNYKFQFNLHQCEYVDYEAPLLRKLDDKEQYYYLCKMCSSFNDYSNNENTNNNNNNEEMYMNYDLYKEHVKLKHANLIKCSLCDENMFKSPDFYIHHLKVEHSLNNLICNCEKCFKTE